MISLIWDLIYYLVLASTGVIRDQIRGRCLKSGNNRGSTNTGVLSLSQKKSGSSQASAETVAS